MVDESGLKEKPILTMQDQPILTKQDLLKGASDAKYMSSKSQLQRFTRYLNHSFYIGADPLMRAKHSQFVQSVQPKKNETVFDRFEQDTKNRFESKKGSNFNNSMNNSQEYSVQSGSPNQIRSANFKGPFVPKKKETFSTKTANLEFGVDLFNQQSVTELKI